jgi:molybdopterin converting factor small subunit
MVVTIELFGIFRDIAKIDKIKMPITGKTLVRDVLEYLGSKYPALSLDKASFLISVNSELVSPDRLLQPDDVICFLPHIGGG